MARHTTNRSAGGARHFSSVDEVASVSSYEVVEPLSGMPVRCVDVAGRVVDVTLMTHLGCNLAHAMGYVDQGDEDRVEERYASYRVASDVAQVVAAYLVCHPGVEEVSYPGLRQDASFATAARTLVGGFGPYVDYRIGDTWRRLVCVPGDARAYVMTLERELAPYV